MIPRRDPETAPVATAIQIIKRRRYDQYGTERGRLDLTRQRPLTTRNGVPVRTYKYRGRGESMDPDEAAQWLFRTRFRPRDWSDCVICEGP